MTTAREGSLSLESLLDSVLDRLPDEVVASLASMRLDHENPKEPCSLADHLIETTQARARKRVAESGPLPDEPDFNEETRTTIEEARAGVNIRRHDTLEDFFAAHAL